MNESRRDSSKIDLATNFSHFCIMIVLFFIFLDSNSIIQKFKKGNMQIMMGGMNFLSKLFIFEMFTEAYITRVQNITLFQYQQIAINKFLRLTTRQALISTENLNLTSFVEFTGKFARQNYFLGTKLGKVSSYGPFQYNLLLNIVLFCLIIILMISIHKIFEIIDQSVKQYKAELQINRELIKYLLVQLIFFIFTITPIILAVNLAGETNMQIGGTKIIFNEAVYRFNDRDANTNAIIQYLTNVLLTITPNITFIFVSGTVPTLSLQLVAIGYVIWKLLDIVNFFYICSNSNQVVTYKF
jgi:hypothetical protein